MNSYNSLNVKSEDVESGNKVSNQDCSPFINGIGALEVAVRARLVLLWLLGNLRRRWQLLLGLLRRWKISVREKAEGSCLVVGLLALRCVDWLIYFIEFNPDPSLEIHTTQFYPETARLK